MARIGSYALLAVKRRAEAQTDNARTIQTGMPALPIRGGC